MAKVIISAEQARELLSYNPETGVLTWNCGRRAGQQAGSYTNEGYLRTDIGKREYRIHRLAWLIVHGSMPPHEIDHINGRRDDNRLVNLRPATNAENQQNIKKAPAQSSHGWLGAHYVPHERKWRSRIRVDGKKLSLGRFATGELAHAAYVEAKRRLHPFSTL